MQLFSLQHQKTHGDTPIACLGCTKSFSCYSLMFEHLESGQCNSKANHERLKLHIDNIYEQEKSYCITYRHQLGNKYKLVNFTCPKCNTEFDRMSLLFQHLETRACVKVHRETWMRATEVDEILFARLKKILWAKLSCTSCDKVFETEELRDEHMWEQHEATFCFICDRHFSSKQGLSYHISGIESGTESYDIKELNCYNCTNTKRFTIEREYYEHVRTVHNSCGVCELLLDTREGLLKHDKEVHFRCDQCYGFFYNDQELFRVSAEPTDSWFADF